MHVHTSDSPDAEIPAWDLARRGVEHGLSAIGFVAHVDQNPEDYCYDAFDPEGYDSSIEQAREEAGDSLVVMQGIEVGEPHRFEEAVKARISYDDYDFVTGALHYVEDFGMILGKDAFLENDPMEVVEGYYLETLGMIGSSDIDVLAHMGLFRRGLAMADKDYAFDETRIWPDLLRRTLTALIDREITLELNTSGLRRREKMTYPTPEVLRLYRDLGGTRVTIGSDSHRDPHVFFGLVQGRKLLLESGFDRLVTFLNREPVETSLQ
jgi:histidinol-phosphatase (PHP family)